VLPCHGARALPLAFGTVRGGGALAEAWRGAPGMQAFRGEAWMPEPCRSCDQRGVDFGGCRCQALALTGDLRATDPACSLSPGHHLVRAARERAELADVRAAGPRAEGDQGAERRYVARGARPAAPVLRR
jgi:pyrroloquinoline quinone biosynthesis protein E